MEFWEQGYIGHQRGYEAENMSSFEGDWVRHASEDKEPREGGESGYTMHDDLSAYFSQQPMNH